MILELSNHLSDVRELTHKKPCRLWPAYTADKTFCDHQHCGPYSPGDRHDPHVNTCQSCQKGRTVQGLASSQVDAHDCRPVRRHAQHRSIFMPRRPGYKAPGLTQLNIMDVASGSADCVGTRHPSPMQPRDHVHRGGFAVPPAGIKRAKVLAGPLCLQWPLARAEEISLSS